MHAKRLTKDEWFWWRVCLHERERVSTVVGRTSVAVLRQEHIQRVRVHTVTEQNLQIILIWRSGKLIFVWLTVSCLAHGSGDRAYASGVNTKSRIRYQHVHKTIDEDMHEENANLWTRKACLCTAARARRASDRAPTARKNGCLVFDHQGTKSHNIESACDRKNEKHIGNTCERAGRRGTRVGGCTKPLGE